MPLTIYTVETKEVPVQVAGLDLSDDSPIDPTASAVTVGFVSSADGGRVPPPTGQFYGAAWVANATRELYYAVIIVGPDGGVIVLPPGTYVPWVKFVLGGETIIQPANDTLIVLA